MILLIFSKLYLSQEADSSDDVGNLYYLGHVTRKPVFGVFKKASFKSVSTATQTG